MKYLCLLLVLECFSCNQKSAITDEYIRIYGAAESDKATLEQINKTATMLKDRFHFHEARMNICLDRGNEYLATGNRVLAEQMRDSIHYYLAAESEDATVMNIVLNSK